MKLEPLTIETFADWAEALKGVKHVKDLLSDGGLPDRMQVKDLMDSLRDFKMPPDTSVLGDGVNISYTLEKFQAFTGWLFELTLPKAPPLSEVPDYRCELVFPVAHASNPAGSFQRGFVISVLHLTFSVFLELCLVNEHYRFSR